MSTTAIATIAAWIRGAELGRRHADMAYDSWRGCDPSVVTRRRVVSAVTADRPRPDDAGYWFAYANRVDQLQGVAA